ncbi:MAG: protein kinase [Pirellulales bacterium]|nr:protein kinase [Pirellulales bacterium]
MSDTHVDIDLIFAEALKKTSPEARSAYLDEACGDNIALRHQVEELLDAYNNAGDFLEVPAGNLDVTSNMQEDVEKSGTVIGPYKLLQKIGEGGMGVVYMAEQTEPVERRVALKIIKPGMDTRQVIARFEAERQALAMMDHPNISKVFDAGATESGRPYFVMELVKGVPITQYCDEHQLSPRERLELLIPVCQAVQHAHQKGIIHRDIKPSNVMVAEYDDRAVPKIIDFGVAKAIEQRLTAKTMFTQLGQMVGTVDYMSPEQAKLNQLDIDTRSDIYSLGVLLYELLTGETPLDRERLHSAAFDEMLRIIREEEPPKPSLRLSSSESLPSIAAKRHIEPKKLSTLVRGELDWIVMKALEKDRTRRYETANGFANDINRYLTDEAVMACPPSVAYRLRKFARRNTATIVTASAIALALILGLVGTSWQWVQATRAREKESVQRIAATAAREEETIARKEAEAAASREKQAHRQSRCNLYVSDVNLAQWACEQGNLGHAINLLKRHFPQVGQEDLREFAWYYWWRRAHRFEISLDNKKRCWSVAYAPNGKMYASSSGSSIHIWDAKTGERKATFHAPLIPGLDQEIRAIAFSPDSNTIAAGGLDKLVRLWDVKTRTLKKTLSGHEDRVFSVAFSPDGETVASGSDHGTINLWLSTTGLLKNTWGAHKSGKIIWSLIFSRNGKNLVSGSHDKTAIVWDISENSLKPHLLLKIKCSDAIHSMAVSPDGQTLATGEYDGDVTFWNLNTGRRTAQVDGRHKGNVTCVTFSPDGKQLFSCGDDSTIFLWDLSTNKMLDSLGGHMHNVYSLAISPDGSSLVSGGADGTVKIWDAAPQIPEPTVLHNPRNDIRCATFSPNGHLLAMTGYGALSLWNRKTKNKMFECRGTFDSLAFSPHSGFLASGKVYGEIWIWTLPTNNPPKKLKGHNGSVISLAFSPNGRLLASGTFGDGVILWDVETTKQKHKCNVPDFSTLAFVDEKTLVTGNWQENIKFWDVKTGRELKKRSLRIPNDDGYCGIWDLAVSPDKKTIAAALHNGTIKTWNIETGKLQSVFHGHSSGVMCVAFSPDGKTLASGGLDFTARLWNLETEQCVSTLHHQSLVHSVAFTPDGNTLISCDETGEARLWRAASKEEIRTPSDPLPANVLWSKNTEWLKISAEEYRLTEAKSCCNQGKDYRNAGKFDKSLTAYSKAIRLYPDLAEVHKGRGDTYRAMRKFCKAVDDYTEALNLNPYNKSISALLAKCYWDLGERDKVDDILKAATDLVGSKSATTLFNRWSWQFATSAKPQELAPDLAVKLARKALDLQPKERVLWNILGVAEYRAGNWEEAIKALDRSTKLHGCPSFRDTLFKAMVLSKMGNKGAGRRLYIEAIECMMQEKNHMTRNETDRFLKEAVELLDLDDEFVFKEAMQNLLDSPVRITGKQEFIDLQPKANQKLTDGLGLSGRTNNLAELPTGAQTFAGVKFQIDESLVLLGSRRLPRKPKKVEGIPINMAFTKLYILHGAQWVWANDGTQIGQYRVHFEGGVQETIPIVIGEDVRDWWSGGPTRVSRGHVAWIGQNAVSRKKNRVIRLYLAAWKNPHPKRKVVSIDLLSSSSTAAPFCVAMTAEQNEGTKTDVLDDKQRKIPKSSMDDNGA